MQVSPPHRLERRGDLPHHAFDLLAIQLRDSLGRNLQADCDRFTANRHIRQLRSRWNSRMQTTGALPGAGTGKQGFHEWFGLDRARYVGG